MERHTLARLVLVVTLVAALLPSLAAASQAAAGSVAAEDAVALAPPPEVCASLATLVELVFDVPTALGTVPFEAFPDGASGFACQVVASGTGEDFGDFLTAAEGLATELRGLGWQPDDRYLADGPTGTASGWRRGDDLALVSIGWWPAPAAACPEDEPIVACDVAAELQEFTLTVVAARVGAAAAALDALPAVSAARQYLAQVLQADPRALRLETLEDAVWPDACLGVTVPDRMCAQAMTRGYRAVLVMDGDRYVLHTDTLGDAVVLSLAPPVDVTGALAWWRGAGPDGCLEAWALPDHAGVAVGPCGGPRVLGGFVRLEHLGILDDVVASYAPFEVDTPDAVASVAGHGSAPVAPGRARASAELLRAMAIEAAAGRTGASWNVALTAFVEEGERCDGQTAQLHGSVLTVSAFGWAEVWACRDDQVVHVGSAALGEGELERLYDWLDRLGPVELGDERRAVTLAIAGRGTSTPSAPAREALLDFALALLADVVR